MVPSNGRLECYTVLAYVSEKYITTELDRALAERVYALKDSRAILDNGKQRPAVDLFAEAVHYSVHGWLTGSTLVPLPTSDATKLPRDTERNVLFAKALAKRFNCAIYDGLLRSTTIRKNHKSSDRNPVAAHIASMSARPPTPSGNLVLIDDVCTMGSSFMGAAITLRKAGSSSTIRCLAGGYARMSSDALDYHHRRFALAWAEGSEHPNRLEMKSLAAKTS